MQYQRRDQWNVRDDNETLHRLFLDHWYGLALEYGDEPPARHRCVELVVSENCKNVECPICFTNNTLLRTKCCLAPACQTCITSWNRPSCPFCRFEFGALLTLPSTQTLHDDYPALMEVYRPALPTQSAGQQAVPLEQAFGPI